MRHFGFPSLFATFLVLAFNWAATAFGETATTLRGVALVIGQSDYETLALLPNPERDVDLIEEVLDGLGFDVTRVRDRKAARLRDDLADFVAEAEGADVAVVYYAGHGIEAAGENWLVPVDADLQSPATGDMLIGLSPVIEALSATVPLTFFFLDACRDNPFPEGTLLRREGADYPITASGLDLPRSAKALDGGAAPLEAAGGATGTAIGYAAEPGAAALDGPAGGNSYYAAALARHLDASVSVEFATVMRLVTEEVWLKTGGRQRPWVNMSLTQLLYFGGEEVALSAEDALILGERRQLLLSIADLDTAVRKQVEAAADAEGVPMDALYGLVRSLGVEVSRDPDALAAALKAQVETLQAQLKGATDWRAEDPEVARLIDLSNLAVSEGALAAARQFADQALARVRDRRTLRETVREDLRQADLEDGRVTANAAEKHALAGDHLAAAALYAEAFAQVETWDGRVAADYKSSEALSLYTQGDLKGDNAALGRAIDAYRNVLALIDRGNDPDDWAVTQNNLGLALSALGRREPGTARLEEAVVAFRAALEERTRDRVPLDWAATQNNLGNALWALGNREPGTARLEEAVVAYRAALEEFSRDLVPLDWAATQNNLGTVLQVLGEREPGTARLEEAIVAFRAALEERTRDRVPLDWAMTQNNLGTVLYALGNREPGTARLEEAVMAYRAALEERTRDRVPLDWAAIQNNLGTVLQTLGDRETGTGRLEEAVVAYRAALEERTRNRVPLDWAMTQNNLGRALQVLGEREPGTARLEEAVVAFRAALEESTRDRVPLDWAATQNNLGNALQVLGQRETGTERLEEAVVAYRAALEERTRDRVPLDWAMTQNNLGAALSALGQREPGTARLEEAIVAFRAALEVRTRDRVPLDWAATLNNLGTVLHSLGEREPGTERLEEAVIAYRAALEERTRDRVPLAWARTHYNLGSVLLILGERGPGTVRLEEAVVAYRAALEEITRDRVPLDWATTQHNLGLALQYLGMREPGVEHLEQAVVALRAALEERTRDRIILDWARTNYVLGNALDLLANRKPVEMRATTWLQAIDAWSNAQEAWNRDAAPQRWAQLQNATGYTLVLVFEITGERRHLDEAVPTLREALEVQTTVDPGGLPFTRDSLCRALLNLGRLDADRDRLLEARALCLAAREGLEALGADQAIAETDVNLDAIERALEQLE